MRLRVEHPSERTAASRTPRAPQPAAERLLALQRSAGNQAVARYVRPGGGAAPSPQFLAAWHENEWLDGAPMRTLNVLLGVASAEGAFTEATFFAVDALVPGAAQPGVVDDAVLGLLLPDAVENGLQTQFAHIVEQQVFNGARIALSLRFDPALPAASKSVAEGQLHAVVLGPAAFADLAALRAALSAGLPPIQGPAGKPAPQLLAGDAVKAAAEHNATTLTEFVSATIVEAAIGGHDDQAQSEAFAQWVADYQHRRQLPATGKLDDATMAKIVDGLVQEQRFGAVLELVIDYFVLDRNTVGDVRFNADVTPQPFALDRGPGGTTANTWLDVPVTIDFGRSAFTGNLAGIYHTVADAFAEVEARHEGFGERDQQLMGKAEQLIATGHSDLQESEPALRADVRDFNAIWHALRPAHPGARDHRMIHLPLLRKVVERVEGRFKALGVPGGPELHHLRFLLHAMEP